MIKRRFGLLPVVLLALLVLSGCGSADDEIEVGEDVATRVTVAGAPLPLPTLDPNATPAEDDASAQGESGGDAAESEAAPAEGGGAVVELSAPGIAWSTNELTVPVGGTINLFNDGSGGQHDFVIEGYNDDDPVDMPVGETVAWTVPADLAPGTYTFYCSVPGHRPAGMEGTITIQ